MSKKIGLTFAAEVEAAGLLGLPFSWSNDGVTFGPDLSAADRARVQAVIDAHDPAKPLPAPVPQVISDRQFAEGLWHDGLITYEQYLAFVGPGTIPPPLLAILDTLPDDDTGRPTPRKLAVGLVTGATQYLRSAPLVDVVRQAQGWTQAQLDDHWRAWAAL